jgi:hypothetical protein
MESHKLPADPFIDPFELEQEPVKRKVRPNISVDLYVVGIGALLLLSLLVGLILTAPARGMPSITSTPRPIMPAGCYPPACVMSTVGPTMTPTPEPTETLAVATVQPKPDWLSYGCLMTMQKIMQYELNGSTDVDAYRFLATQLIWRANSNKACDFDGQWTGYAKTEDIQPITGAGLNAALSDYPAMQWPYCQYVGSFGDVRTWLLKNMVDRTKPIIGFYADPYGNIFGVNCTPG